MENNPYLGPRAYRETDTVRLYGREREADELLDRLIAERVIVLYSPSGAGKTSLIEALIVPRLKEFGFRVFPRIRVGLEAGSATTAFNRYVLSTLMSLDGDSLSQDPSHLANLSSMQLENYFDQPSDASDTRGDVLIFDQFEEVFTLNAADQARKEEFFTQLGGVLRNRSRWVLISMREEFLGNLEPFVKHLPSRLADRYRLDLLGPEAAWRAVKGPAGELNVTLTDQALRQLVDDLRLVREVDPNSGLVSQVPGPSVEPVHLQVACHEMWNELDAAKLERDEKGTLLIGESEVRTSGDVNEALRTYYTNAVDAVVRHTKVSERVLRTWISTQLITPQRLRNQVMREVPSTAGLDNEVIERLSDAYLVRTERRRGLVWYELAHDRLIDPMLQDNEAWSAANASHLQRMAEFWKEQGRPDRMLLRTDSLDEAERFAKNNLGLSPVEQEFLNASREGEVKSRLRSARVRLAVVSLIAVLAIAAMGMTLGNVRLNTQKSQAAAYRQQQKDTILAYVQTALLSPDSAERKQAEERLLSIVAADSITSRPAVSDTGSAGQVALKNEPVPDFIVEYFYKNADSSFVEVALAPLGYRLQGRKSRAGAGGPQTNAILYGDPVPLEHVQRVALALVAAGVQVKRIGPFDNPARRAEAKIQILGQYYNYILAAPTLTADSIRSLSQKRPYVGPKIRR